MKHLIHLSIAATAAALLTGCASGPRYSDAKQSGALTPHDGNGMVLIYRTPGFVGVANKPYLYVNQVQQPSQLARGGFYSYEVSPGSLNVACSEQPGESTSKTKTQAVVGGVIGGMLIAGPVGAAVMGGMGASMDIKQHQKIGLDINVLPNETRFIVKGGAGGDLKETSNETGEEEIKSCHWLNPQ